MKTMTRERMQTQTLTDHGLGIEIRGVDLGSDLPASVAQALRDLWHEHAVLVVREQRLDPAAFLRAAQIFGDILPQQLGKFSLPDYPLVGTISSRDLPTRDGKLHVRGENYHTDHSNFREPPMGTMLHAIELPSRGGDTQFVDVRLAYDELPEAMKARIATLRSTHVYESSRSPRKMAVLSPQERAEAAASSQPIVIVHPVSGRAALYLNTGRMEGIEGLPDDEAYALINALYQHATQPCYEYRHRWQPGDFVLWDNRSVMHQANADFDPQEFRYLYRLMLKGAPLRGLA
ncbi:TauD/TfdA family dioxygenase [Verticiella sediminum]|uniref:TauD/TfdA family dioxygenase n=2 Tax=Verticiella sediminum TaxID=1247510 RepID=A0A556A6M7_9BURK|nr:TauD/TfdA family dioxygenase [Verticiella sediminum]